MGLLSKIIVYFIGKKQKQIEDEIPINTEDPFIIGAGWPRTGTSTLRLALAQLGWKSYHFDALYQEKNKHHIELWANVAEQRYIHNNKSFQDIENCVINFNWDLIFKDQYNATLDFPAASFYLDIIKYCEKNGKDYKVILSVRDNPKQWYTSFKNTIFQYDYVLSTYLWFRNIFHTAIHVGKIQKYINYATISNGSSRDFLNQDKVEQRYLQYIESVKKNVSKDKLLIFNVKEGWIPLCGYLYRSVPSNENKLPSTNDTAKFNYVVKRLKIIGIFVHILVALCCAVCIYFLF